MLGMTFEEFLKQMERLHRRYPSIYRRAEQVRIAFHLYGVPLEWFKDRVDYVIISGRGHFDWVDAIQRARRSNRFVEISDQDLTPKLNKKYDLSAFERALQSLGYDIPALVEQMKLDKAALAAAIGVPKEQIEADISRVTYQSVLASEGVSSVVELLEKKKGGGDGN